MSDITIITNNHSRDVLYGRDLTPAERTEFDWIDSSNTVTWDEAEFFRYRGTVYYLESEGRPTFAPGWDAYLSDSFFSGIVYRYPVIELSQPLPRCADRL